MNEVLKKLLFVMTMILLFSGCAQQSQVHDVAISRPEQCIVFGKLELMKEGKIVPWSSFWSGREGRIIFLPPNSNKAQVYKVAKDGFFYWDLEPGDYFILSFEISEGGDFSRGDLRIPFSVSEERKNIYIGNLKVLMQGGWYYVGIDDDYSAALESFKNKFPYAQEPVKILASLQQKEGTYKKIKYICTDDWGIECKNKPYGVGFIRFEGVKPINPEVSIGISTDINTLNPTFEWSPSSLDNVTYDLIIYEAASYSRSGLDNQYVPGRLFLYEENIKDISYKITKTLQPKTKYFWSVRLRLNDDVSTWSKYSFFQTIILVTGGGSSNWFTFDTP